MVWIYTPAMPFLPFIFKFSTIKACSLKRYCKKPFIFKKSTRKRQKVKKMSKTGVYEYCLYMFFTVNIFPKVSPLMSFECAPDSKLGVLPFRTTFSTFFHFKFHLLFNYTCQHFRSSKWIWHFNLIPCKHDNRAHTVWEKHGRKKGRK